MIGPSNRSLSPRTHSPIIRLSVFGGPPGSNSFIDLALHKQEVYMSASPPRAVVYTKTLELFDLERYTDETVKASVIRTEKTLCCRALKGMEKRYSVR